MKKLIIFCVSACSFFQSYATNYYWVGGSGNWSDYARHWATNSGGTTFHTQVPTNLDHVFFDQNSGFTAFDKTVSVDQTIVYCNNMDWTGVLNYPTFKSVFANNTLKIFGSLKLSPNMNVDFTTSNISFESISSGKTITCSGRTIQAYTLYFNGINGQWTFTDAFNANKVVHNAGTIHTNNQVLNIRSFEATGTADAAFDIGSSVCNITQNTMSFFGSPVSAWNISNTNYVFDPSQSTINFLGNLPVGFYSNTYHYKTVTSGTGLLDFVCVQCTVDQLTFSDDGNIAGKPTFNTLAFAQGGIYNMSDTITIKDGGNLVANGTCSKPIFLQSQSRMTNYVLRKNTGTVDVNYVYLQNSVTLGTTVFNANNSYALANVSGWNVSNPLPKNLYWIGGGGVWSDPNHWSETSGGAVSSGCVPTYADNVYFDQNSGLGNGSMVQLDIYKSQCKTMDWSGITTNVTLYGMNCYLYVSGSLILSPKLSFNFSKTHTILNSKSMGNTITCAGKTIPDEFVLDGVGGEWSLLDSLGAKDMKFYNGSLVTNSQTINLSTFDSYPDNVNSVKLNLQNSKVKVSGTGNSWSISYPRLDFQCGTSTIILNSSTGTQQLYGGSYTFNNIYSLSPSSKVNAAVIRKLYFARDGFISGNQMYDSLIFTEGHQYTLDNSSYTINQALVANGTCGKFITISGSSFYHSTFYKSSGTVACNALILSNCNASGGASFVAANSIATTSVTGWTITVYTARNLYWVGGSGDWSDQNHWSLLSGGTGGECPPVQFDNIYFNQSSNLVKGSVITVTSITPEFKDMDWSGINAKCTLSASDVNCYGSMVLHDSLQASMSPTFYSAGNSVIKSCNKKFYVVTFAGTGSWQLLDNFTTTGNLKHSSGTLNVNGKTITIGNGYSANIGSGIVLDLRNSKMVIVKSGFYASSEEVVFKLLKDNSYIEFLNQDPFWYPAGINYFTCCIFSEVPKGIAFNKVICRNNTGKFYIREGQHSFSYFLAEGGADFSNSSKFDTLSLTPGRTYTFAAGSTQTINSLLDAIGQPGFPIEMLSSSVNNAVSIYKASGTVCAEYLYLKDIHATGGATFYAGANGANVSNNTGWNFSACNSTTAVTESNEASEVMVYPIPVAAEMHVMVKTGGSYNIQLYNMQGVEVLNTAIEGGYERILNTSSYPAGMYLVTVFDKELSKTYKVYIVH